MKKLVLIACFFLIGKSGALAGNIPANYVVLLDLSDRILQPDQARRDQELIRIVFERFEQKVRNNLIINSKDRFRVVVAPQKSTKVLPGLDDLYLDMGQVPFADKRIRLEALKRDLPAKVARLYAAVLAGRRKPADFTGSDLWRYANESLPTDLDKGYANTWIILTDGYFDFEKNPSAFCEGNRCTDSRVLDRLRKMPDWQKVLAAKDEGLVQIKKTLPPISVYVAEMRAKREYLREMDLLTSVWKKWLGEMGVRRMGYGSCEGLSKSADLLRSFLKT